jgi:D-arabinose 1-dehydrogenase-like Zn-dependent alcohol dehydrogenase
LSVRRRLPTNALYLQGHYAALFAKVVGGKVYGSPSFSHKIEDLKRLGAFHAVTIDDNGELAKNLAFELDLIVSPRDMVHGPFTLTEYIKYV